MRARHGPLSALRSTTGARRVLVAYALLGLVEFTVWVVVVLWAYAAGGPGFAALVAAVQLVPAALAAPALASAGDRLPRGTALVLGYSLVAVTALLTCAALASGAPWAVVVVASTCLNTGLAVARPLHFAALPMLSPTPSVLVSANVVSSVSDGVFRFVGPLLAALLVARTGYAGAVGFAVAAAALAAALCLRLGLPAAPSSDETGSLRVAVGGLLALRGDWAALALLLVLTIDFVVAGAVDILGVAFATDVLGLPVTDGAVVIAALGAGTLVGALLAAGASRRPALAPLVVVGGLVEGALFAAVAATSGLLAAAVLLVVSGAGGAVMLVTGRTLLQRTTDDRVLARVFAVQESTTLLAVCLGALLAPALITLLGARWAFVPVGLGCAVLALACLPLVRRLEARAVLRPRETALLAGLPFLAGLPAYELERLARHARWSEVPEGTLVVRQGDIGDAFYVVDSGALVVDVDGVRTDRPLAAGDGFGEVALVRGGRRTADVTAVTDTRLLVLDRVDFLAAVTGSADGLAVAQEAADSHLEHDRRRAG